MNIFFTVSQLARFCASAGTAQWAALQHLMEYLEGNPSFKITYRRSYGKTNLLSGYADSDWGNSSSRRSTPRSCCTTNRRSRGSRRCRRPRCSLRQRPSTTLHRRRPRRFYTSASSWTDWDSPRLALLQFMRITQHVLSGATTSSADERGPSTSTSGRTSPTKSCDAAYQGPNLGSAGGHLDQGASPSASSDVCRGHLGTQEDLTLKGTSVLKRGWIAKATKSSHVGP